MNRIILLLALGLISLLQNTLTAQMMNHLRGEILVQLVENAHPERLASRVNYVNPKIAFRSKKLLSQNLNIWRFTFDANVIDEHKMLSIIQRDKQVQSAQFNHFVKLRSTVPDDPLFDNQWQYINTGTMGGVEDADLDADLAWDVTTGGVTALGDTIVVCVIDGGIDLAHEDFEDNLWVNHAEIPNNGVDDDNNGYVDDVRGWFSDGNNDNVNGNAHGTSVAGIIGAKGNNNKGVTGISWNVKVMVVRSNSGLESAVIAAYDYPLTHRKKYNETNGAEGAFVVATNASWGIDGGMAADAPIWCSFYDTLGSYGIINCGATANANVNVEVVGDLPTTCPSDYLIGVTNIKRNNEKETLAGYGDVSIDLASYGTGVYTTNIGGGYSAFGGTSGATPQVTGTIGLLYSIPCTDIATLAQQNPAACALLMREAILESVVSNTALQGITTTEGHLNTNDALNYLLDICDGCFRPSVLRADDKTDTQASLSWAQTPSVQSTDLRWRLVGSEDWTNEVGVEMPYLLAELMSCTDYEFQVKSNCDGSSSDYSESFIFRTDGCCEAPLGTSVWEVDSTSAMIAWESVLAATSYLVNYRELGTSSWNSLLAFSANYTITGLEECTQYEYRIETKCGVMSGGFTAIETFLTSNCGSCAEMEYCTPNLQDVDEEWIGHFSFGDIDNVSENDLGYGNYSLLGNFVFEKGQSYPLSIEPEYLTFTHHQEDVVVWVDWNKDGLFQSHEQLFRTPETISTVFNTNIIIPPNVEVGETRLRVAMMFNEVTGPCPIGIGVEYGEMEDYCVTIEEAQSCVPVFSIDTTDLTLNSVVMNWQSITVANNYTLAYRKKGTVDFITATTFSEVFTFSELEKCTDYEVKITTNCTTLGTVDSELFEFYSGCDVGWSSIHEIQEWKVYPNPFHNQFSIGLTATKGKENISWSVYNQYGQKIETGAIDINEGENQLEVETNDWPVGIYFVALLSEDGQQQTVRKIVKVK